MAKVEAERPSRCCAKRPRNPSPPDEEDEQVVESQLNSSIYVTLSDLEVLDCPVCFECLEIPVFQCDSGHVAWSSCCTKLKNKCPLCSRSPIGYIRCLAIEKVLESAKISCKHSQYGCKEKSSYIKRDDHEGKCPYTPCSCPIASNCKFVGSFKQLSKHLINNHSLRVKCFLFNRVRPISMGKTDKLIVLEEDNGGSLFILNNTVKRGMGNAISVTCVGPGSLKTGFSYDLVAKGDEGTTLRLQSVTEGNSASTGFLIVPADLFSSSRQLKLELCIRANSISRAGT